MPTPLGTSTQGQSYPYPRSVQGNPSYYPHSKDK
jgi:hypothetical protein